MDTRGYRSMRRSSYIRLALLLGALSRAALPPAHAADGPALPILAERLPARPFACALGGAASRPDEVLRGKPALLVFADAQTGLPAGIAAALAALQPEFAPWLGWGAVLVGPGAPGGGSPLAGPGRWRLDACWSDPDGS